MAHRKRRVYSISIIPPFRPRGHTAVTFGRGEQPDGIHSANETVRPYYRLWESRRARRMQETEWVINGFVPCFGVRVSFYCIGIEKLAEFGQVDDFHRAFLKEINY